MADGSWGREAELLYVILLVIFLIQFLVILAALIFAFFLARPEVPLTGNSLRKMTERRHPYTHQRNIFASGIESHLESEIPKLPQLCATVLK